MIITKIRIQEEHPMASGATSWPLPPCDLVIDSTAGDNGYLLKTAFGMGPPNMLAAVEGFDSAGIPIMTSIPDDRELAFRIMLKPKLGQSFNELRDDLYKFMSRSVLVSFMNDSMVIAQTTGYIRQFEALHFASQPEIQMTILCDDGELSGPKAVSIPLSTLNTLTPTIVYGDGTAPTGLDLQFTCTAGHSGFTISDHAKFWYSGTTAVDNDFTLTYSFLTNDVVTISTGPNKKRITMVRSSVTYDLSGRINAGAVWPKLHAGVNVFTWDFASSWMTWNSASYIPKYWGV
jgi:hypothetical protein